jgi:hypothetical protein
LLRRLTQVRKWLAVVASTTKSTRKTTTIAYSRSTSNAFAARARERILSTVSTSSVIHLPSPKARV